MITFSAHGKLLLTGEYLVLDGAGALALPLSLGQNLAVEAATDGLIHWESMHNEGHWFTAVLNHETLELLQSEENSRPEAMRLSEILMQLKQLNGSIFQAEKGYHVRTSMDFHPSWGLGSSSTLISLLATWADVDPYLLLRRTFGGSGYDIACASASGPIIYRNPEMPTIEPVSLGKVFSDTLVIYSGKKMDSRKAMDIYRSKLPEPGSIHEISELTRLMVKAGTTQELIELIGHHETILSGILEHPTLKESKFPDFNGQVKSLGAWGGDFFLAASNEGIEYMRNYFSKHLLQLQYRLADIGLGLTR